MRYRNKPLTIEAFQYDGGLKSDIGYYVPEWAVKAYEEGKLFYRGDVLYIARSDFHSKISIGDYIWKDNDGYIGYSSAKIFESIYEPAY